MSTGHCSTHAPQVVQDHSHPRRLAGDFAVADDDDDEVTVDASEALSAAGVSAGTTPTVTIAPSGRRTTSPTTSAGIALSPAAIAHPCYRLIMCQVSGDTRSGGVELHVLASRNQVAHAQQGLDDVGVARAEGREAESDAVGPAEVGDSGLGGDPCAGEDQWCAIAVETGLDQ